MKARSSNVAPTSPLYAQLEASWETSGDSPPQSPTHLKRRQLASSGRQHCAVWLGGILSLTVLTCMASSYTPHLRTSQDRRLFAAQLQTPTARGGTLDALVVPGGGLTSQGQPHPFVKLRLDHAATTYRALPVKPKIIVLSGGTTHKPPPLDHKGFPITEAHASARYLLDQHSIPSYDILEEGFSLDTIGNAYWLRTIHTDVTGLRKLQVITNEFHMPRTQAVFDFVFSLPTITANQDDPPYDLSFLPVADEGMDHDALEARKTREKESIAAFRQRMKTAQIQTMSDLHSFLFTEHMAYASTRLEQPPIDLDETTRQTY